MPDVLFAEAHYCRSPVALCGYTRHMANVSVTLLATACLIQTVGYTKIEVIFFSGFAGSMNSRTPPISIKWI